MIFLLLIPFVLNGLFNTPNVSKNFQMLQPFTRILNFRTISTSIEFSKNETAMVSRPYSALVDLMIEYVKDSHPLHGLSSRTGVIWFSREKYSGDLRFAPVPNNDIFVNVQI